MNTFLARNGVLVMDNNKIESGYQGGYNQWLTDNSALVTKDINERPSSCTHQKTIVQLLGFDNPRTQIGWLRLNTGYICFEESYYYIQGSHSVSILLSDIDNQINEQINNLIIGDTTEMNALKISLEDLLTNYALDFDKYDYQKMLWFQLIPKTNPGETHQYVLTITSQTDLVDGNVYYSMPFFRSILKENKVTDFKNCYFYFAAIKVDGRDSIGFKVDYQNTNVGGFYDYSTTPGTGTSGGGITSVSKMEGSKSANERLESAEALEALKTFEYVQTKPKINYL